MAVEPPPPPNDPEFGDRARAPSGDGGRGRRERWWQLSGAAWRRLRSLPAWSQAVLWLLAWPATAALYVARNRRLGALAPPLTAVILLGGGLLWWVDPITRSDGARPQAYATARPVTWEQAPVPDPVAVLPVAAERPATEIPEFDPSTLEIEFVECVQTRSVSHLGDRTIRQPRASVRVTNLGPDRSVGIQAAVLLDAYEWNGGWKPTAVLRADLAHGESVEATLMPDYRHQSSYTPDGLRACGLLEVELLAPNRWPDHPARHVAGSELEQQVIASTERAFDPHRDLLRTDTR